MVKLEELLGAGALAILAKKLMEGATTTTLPIKPQGLITQGLSQEEYKKGLTTFLQDLSAGPGAYKGNGLEPGYKKDYDPKQIFSLWEPGPITEIKQPVIIPSDYDWTPGYIEGSETFGLEDISKKIAGGRL